MIIEKKDETNKKMKRGAGRDKGRQRVATKQGRGDREREKASASEQGIDATVIISAMLSQSAD